jgi:putative spermidine/putrescine transport system ATP-binding protein
MDALAERVDDERQDAVRREHGVHDAGTNADAQSVMNMVELSGVTKRYGDVAALSTIDLAIAKGEFVTLLGPSGSGKTTLLNMIAGMIAPTSGRIYLDGVDATDRPPSQRGLGMVFQNYALMPHMTVFENIAFPLRVRKMAGADIRLRVAEVLELVRLPGIEKRKPRELSGGQQQRVSLARCIVYNPRLILMDEPLGALDKKLREQMQLEIKRIHSELGITMINVTHDQDEALTMSDRIVLLNQGRIEQDSTPADLYFHPRTVFAADFIGDANLFAARLDGDASARGVSAETSFGRATATRPDFEVSPGMPVTLLVRPENVRVRGDGPASDTAASTIHAEAASDRTNECLGIVRDSIVLGGVVKHHIGVEGVGEVVVQEPNHLRRAPLAAGAPVHLSWSPEDCVVLPARADA